jgi:hypothetical protein
VRNPTPSRISAELRRLARPAGEFDALRYFRGAADLRFHNVGTAAVRALARAIHDANRDWTVDDAMRLAGALMRDPYLEAKAVGIEVVARHRRAFAPGLLPEWERWLAGNLASNWATTDLLCGLLIGPILVQKRTPARTDRRSNVLTSIPADAVNAPCVERGSVVSAGRGDAGPALSFRTHTPRSFNTPCRHDRPSAAG